MVNLPQESSPLQKCAGPPIATSIWKKRNIERSTAKLLCCLLTVLVNCWALCGGEPVPACAVRSSANGLIRDAAFYSASLERDMHYRVLLPRQYENGDRFPVLYLLHGLFGDYRNWDTKTHLENYSVNLRIIIVMPDADDSWYTNSSSTSQDKFEDYIAKDLVSEIDNRYPTIHNRYARAVAGNSMGGYGAVKLGIKYPQLFAFSGSLSGAFDAAENLDELRPDFRAKLDEVFGQKGSRVRTHNDVFLLLDAPHEGPYPYFYLGCGTEDFFLDTNRALVRKLSSLKIPYEYHETPGNHTWEYWDGALEPMLQAVARVISPRSPVHPVPLTQ